MSDAELVRAVEQAAADRVAPAAVDGRIAARPWLDSRKHRKPGLFLRNLVSDEEAGEPLPRDITRARTLVAWTRPIEARNPRVVGLYWMADGIPHRFFAVVLPH